MADVTDAPPGTDVGDADVERCARQALARASHHHHVEVDVLAVEVAVAVVELQNVCGGRRAARHLE